MEVSGQPMGNEPTVPVY